MLKLALISQFFQKEYTIDGKRKNINEDNNKDNNKDNSNEDYLDINKHINSPLNFYLFYDIFIARSKNKKRQKEINSVFDYLNNNNNNNNNKISCNKNQIKIQLNYEFQNKILIEETKRKLQKTNRGFLIFLDKFFSKIKLKKKNNNNNNEYNYNNNNEYNYNNNYECKIISNKNFKFFRKIKINKENNNEINYNNTNTNINSNNTNSNNYNNNNYYTNTNSNNNINNNNNKINIDINIINYNTFSTNRIFSRKFIAKNYEFFLLKTKKAIKIQTNFRRFISQKKNLTQIFNKKIIFICQKIFKIQSFWKTFLQKRALNKKILIKNITYSLNIYSFLITKIFKKFKNIENFKKNFLISLIKNQRNFQAIKIQKNFRGFFVKKFVKNYLLKEKNCFKITYPYKAYDVQIKFFIPKNESEKNCNKKILVEEKIFKFEFSKFENNFVLLLNEENIRPGKYRAIYMIDNVTFCDGRFPHVEFSDGNYYNIIDVKYPYINIKKNFMEKNRYLKDNNYNANNNDYKEIKESFSYSNNSTEGNIILRKNTNFTYDNDNGNGNGNDNDNEYDLYNKNTDYNKDNKSNGFLLSDSFYEIANKKEHYNKINNDNFNWYKEYISLQKNLRFNSTYNKPLCYMDKLKELIKEESLDLDLDKIVDNNN